MTEVFFIKTSLRLWLSLAAGLVALLVVAVLSFRFSAMTKGRAALSALQGEEASSPILPRLPAHTEENRSNYCERLPQTVCGRRDPIQDVTGVVQTDVRGELEALRLYEKLIHDHPTYTSDQVDEVLVSLIYTEKRRKRLNEVFTWVVAAMEKLIQSQPSKVFSPVEKTELLTRIRNTHLELPPPATLYTNELDLFTKNDVYYEGKNQGQGFIRVGGAYVLTAKSWFNRVFTFAHELAHAVDPCMARASSSPILAYEKLSACFVRQGIIKARTKESRCGDNDQYPEAFADWIATKITAEALREYAPKFKSFQDVANAISNSVRDLCDQETWLETNISIYPPPKVRIGTLFEQAPPIQRLLGCQENIVSQYCEFE